jgi:hypothetical protein
MANMTRRAIYFLIITLVINACGWTFNKEAVADVWFDEQRGLTVDGVQSSSGHDGIEAVSSQSPCNHWCHALGHFTGLISQPVPVIPEFSNKHSTQYLFAVQPYSPNGLFRPPRRIS